MGFGIAGTTKSLKYILRTSELLFERADVGCEVGGLGSR